MTAGALIAAGALVPAVASASTITCSTQSFTQAFLAWGDSNWYTPLGGEAADNFAGTGWTLTSGAKLVTTTLADGTVGQVLDIPAGGKAISPPICVDNTYPTARTRIRMLSGAVGISLQVAYANADGSWGTPASAGSITGGTKAWGLSAALGLPSKALTGTVPAEFIFTGPAGPTEAQIYNFYVDPRMCR